mgnify:CR=1 FL=1
MKCLIAVGSQEFSGPTLRMGMKVANAFNASATIIKVGPKISDFSTAHVRLAQEQMKKWEFDRPGVEVLEWAFNYLAKNNIKYQKLKHNNKKIIISLNEPEIKKFEEYFLLNQHYFLQLVEL